MTPTEIETMRMREQVAALVDKTLYHYLGYRCCFVVTWVKADEAPTTEHYATNVSAADATQMIRTTAQALSQGSGQ
jgi:hypothetical protein